MAKSTGDSSINKEALVAGGLAIAAGAAAFLIARKGGGADGDATVISDVPSWTLLKASQGKQPIAAKTLLVNCPRDQLYEQWKNFSNFAGFMENVDAIEACEGGSSRWTIKAPAGKTVTLITRIREDIPGRKIAWESLPDSDIETKGQVEFEDAGERGTFVSLVMSYSPPGGKVGQIAAKLLGREPNIQARHDLRRFKQLMETGEVTTNASPSARNSESPTAARF